MSTFLINIEINKTIYFFNGLNTFKKIIDFYIFITLIQNGNYDKLND